MSAPDRESDPRILARDRWLRLMSAWGAAHHLDVLAELRAAYAEPHRRYHTGAHLADCLAQLDEAAGAAEEPEVVEMALWFHDAVHVPGSTENERRSAAWADRFLRSLDAAEGRRERVLTSILATRHEAPAPFADAALVADLDLTILGRARAAYDAYERAIREEYRAVPEAVYRRERRGILQSFLDRDEIFQTEPLRARYEKRARANLRRAILSLRDPSGAGP